LHHIKPVRRNKFNFNQYFHFNIYQHYH